MTYQEQPSPLLRLPRELRMMIWEVCFPPFEWDCKIDILRALDFTESDRLERDRVRSCSLLFAHPTIHCEAFAAAIRTHPAIFYNPEDVRKVLKQHPWTFKNLHHIVFDFGCCCEKVMRKSIAGLSRLPSLEYLTIRVPDHKRSYEFQGIELPTHGCRACIFPALLSLEVEDKQIQHKAAFERRLCAIEDQKMAELRLRIDQSGSSRCACMFERLDLMAIQLSRNGRRLDELLGISPEAWLKVFNQRMSAVNRQRGRHGVWGVECRRCLRAERSEVE